MFTTDLSHRVFLTVLLLSVAAIAIGDCEETTATTPATAAAEGIDYNSEVSGIEDQIYDEASFYQSSSPSEDLVAIESPEEELAQTSEPEFEGRSSRMDWRQSNTAPSTPSSTSGMQTVVSSTSYSVKPGNGASTVILNTKPVAIITASNSNDGRKSTVSSSSSFSSPSSTFYTKGSSYPHYTSSSSMNYKKKGEQSTYYHNYDSRNNNCFGNKCLMSVSQDGLHPDLDEWKSYHSTLNSDIKKNKQYQEYPSGSNYGDGFSSGGRYQSRFSSFPFTVASSVPGKQSHYSDRYYPLSRPGHRISRRTTTTNSPGWVQLQPLFSSAVYDPFAYIDNNNSLSTQKSDEFNNRDPQLQFSDRLGVELNPESFADRHGWGSNHESHGGSRLPAWLEQLNQNAQDFRRPGPTRDEDNKNWVKLDPIPVAGVSISKWVPKGTPSSELPTTSWGDRDRVTASGGGWGEQEKPSAYWDHRHHHNNHHHSDSLNILRPGGDGWPSKGSIPSYTTRYPDFLNQRYPSVTKKPTNAWNDIIYPEGPTSATASWEANKAGLSAYQSSFPLSHSSSSTTSSWPSDIRRRPTGSWSAPSLHKSNSNRRYAIHRPPIGLNSHFDRNDNPSTYPDLEANESDPRWVLVSNSRRVAVSPHSSSSSSSQNYHNHRPPHLNSKNSYYNSELSRYSEIFHSGHRLAKDLFKRATTTPPATASTYLDDAFNRINATLQSLTPVLNHRGSSSTRRPVVTQTITPSTATNDDEDFIGDGRATSTNSTIGGKRKVRKGLGINPVVAAVGAGMIPATMAMVVPMVLGRRRRAIKENFVLLHHNDEPNSATVRFLANIRSSSKDVPISEFDYVSFDNRDEFVKHGKHALYKTASYIPKHILKNLYYDKTKNTRN